MSKGFDFYGGTGPGPPAAETREEFICLERPVPWESDPIKKGEYLELTRERAETLLWETLCETTGRSISKAAVREKFADYMVFPSYNSTIMVLWAAFRSLVKHLGDESRARSILLQKLAHYGVTKESRPPWTIDDYRWLCRDIMSEIGIEQNSKKIFEVLDTLRRKNPTQRWSSLLWQVFRELCPTPTKTCEAWNKWLDMTKHYAEEPHPDPIPLTRDVALDVCCNVLKEALVYPFRQDVEAALVRRLDQQGQDGVYWKAVMRDVVLQFCHTEERKKAALEALTRRFYESHDPKQVVFQPIQQGAMGPKIYPGCAAVRNGTQKWLDTPPAASGSGNSQVTELANSIVLEALKRGRAISSLDEWEKSSLVDTLGKQQPAVVERILWDLAQHLVNAKQVPAAGLIHQLSMRTDLSPADMVYQAVKMTVDYLPKFTVDDMLHLTNGVSRRDIESFLQGTIHPIPVEQRLAPRPAASTITATTQKASTVRLEVSFILMDEPIILRVKNLTEGSTTDMSSSSLSIPVVAPGVVGVPATPNPLIASMQARNRSKEMTAAQLLNQTSDKELKRLVTAVQLCLAKEDAWRTFAESKGATSGVDAEAHIARAVKTGEPERFVLADMANYPGYLALDLLTDLCAIRVPAVTVAAEQVIAHLNAAERTAQAKMDAAGRLNAQLRAWLEANRLCAPDEVTTHLTMLVNHGISHLDDMALMTEKHFKECGFTGIYAAKAVNALPTLMAQASCPRSGTATK